jgi:hypothetical protein
MSRALPLAAVLMIFGLIAVTRSYAQSDDVASPAVSVSKTGGALGLKSDHPFVEIDVTIADWSKPDGEDKSGEQRPSLEGETEEVEKTIATLIASRRFSNVRRVRLLAADGKEAMVQTGAQQPVVTGSQFGGRGMTRTVNYQNTGTMINALPRILDGRVVLDLSVSRSGLSTPSDAPSLGENGPDDASRATTMETVTLKTIAEAPKGQTVLVSGWQNGAEGTVILLSARVR